MHTGLQNRYSDTSSSCWLPTNAPRLTDSTRHAQYVIERHEVSDPIDTMDQRTKRENVSCLTVPRSLSYDKGRSPMRVTVPEGHHERGARTTSTCPWKGDRRDLPTEGPRRNIK